LSQVITTNNGFPPQLHLAKLARDSVERGRAEDLKALTRRAQTREEELTAVIADIEEQNGQLVTVLFVEPF